MISAKQVRALVLAGLIIGAALPALAAVFTAPVVQSGDVVYETNSGAAITVNSATNTSSGNPFPNDNTVWINTTKGNATFSATGSVNATITPKNITGATTSVTSLDVSNANLTINPEDKAAITVGKKIDRITFRSMNVDDGNPDFTYAGTDGTTTLVRVRGVAANTQLRAVDASTGDVLETAVSNGSGVATFTDLPNSEHTVELKSGGNNPVLSDPQPDGNLSSSPDKFSVHVDDDDFPGDNVTLKWYKNGTKFNETTATSTGRYDVTAPSLDSGVTDWSIIATDDNGNKDVINATVGIPGDLTIRNETNASQVITDTLKVSIYSGNETFIDKRTVSDGTVNLTGLPKTDFILKIDASDTEWTNRTIYYQNIVGNKSAYLLNTTNASTVTTRFVLDDPTGEFGTNTVIYVKRAINQSGTLKYRTVHADKFGVEGVYARLERDVRYKIVIQNQENTVQDLGPYRAETTETVTVRPGTPTIELNDYNQGFAANSTLDNRTLEYRYHDPNNNTQELTIWIHAKGNTSNRLRPNVSYFDIGKVSGTHTLTANESKKTWVVNFIIEFKDGSTITVQREVSNRPDILPPLDQVWLTIIGVAIMFISAGIFSQLNAGVGGVVVALEGGVLWWLGFLGAATSGAAVVMAIFIAVVGHIYTSRAP